MAGHDAGVRVTCPGCGQVVLQKAMIPLLGDDGKGIRYLCPTCARALISPNLNGANGSTDPQPGSTAPDADEVELGVSAGAGDDGIAERRGPGPAG